MSRLHGRQLLVGLGLFGLLASLYFGLQPVLGAGFVFDDLPNLSPWALAPHMHRAIDVWNFINSSLYLPGRPLALLSFLVDDQNFPPVAATLHRTNLLIHLLNVVLVFAWLRLLLRERSAQADAWALLLSALWAWAPIQVEGVAYIIQRMNLLCSSFSLLALLLLTAAMRRIATSPRRAWVEILSAYGLLMPLAVLCKENGILISLYGLLLVPLLWPMQEQRQRRYFQGLSALPLLALVAWLIPHLLAGHGAASRSFTESQRLWSETRIVCEYIGHTLLPGLHGHSLYRDDYLISRGPVSPPSTLFAALALLGLAIAATPMARLPALTHFGLAFYLLGMSLESSVIPLELYFEHRNYLPSLGLWMALWPALAALYERRRGLLLAALAVYLGLEVFCSHELAREWGRPEFRAHWWLQEQPHSLRAAFAVARLDANAGQPRAALQLLQAQQASHRDSFTLAAAIAVLHCRLEARAYPSAALIELAATSSASTAAATEIKHLLDCPTERNFDLRPVYGAMLRNPHDQDALTQRYLYTDLAHFEQSHGLSAAAIADEQRAYLALPSLDSGLDVAVDLIRLHDIARAHALLLHLQRHCTWIDRLRYPTAVANLKFLLEATGSPHDQHA